MSVTIPELLVVDKFLQLLELLVATRLHPIFAVGQKCLFRQGVDHFSKIRVPLRCEHARCPDVDPPSRAVAAAEDTVEEVIPARLGSVI